LLTYLLTPWSKVLIEKLLAPRLTPKLEDHPVSAVGNCIHNLFAATFHIGGRSSIHKLWTHHAVVTGTNLSRNRLKLMFRIYTALFIPQNSALCNCVLHIVLTTYNIITLLVFVVGANCNLYVFKTYRSIRHKSVKHKHICLHLSLTTRVGLHRPSSGHHCKIFKIRSSTAQLYSQYGIPCLTVVITM